METIAQVTMQQCLCTTRCNTLQRTATHCNTLQHTATHCNTPQHAATRCDMLQHTATHLRWPIVLINIHGTLAQLSTAATHCNTLQHAATRCNMLRHAATHCNTPEVNYSINQHPRHLSAVERYRVHPWVIHPGGLSKETHKTRQKRPRT